MAFASPVRVLGRGRLNNGQHVNSGTSIDILGLNEENQEAAERVRFGGYHTARHRKDV